MGEVEVSDVCANKGRRGVKYILILVVQLAAEH